MPTRMSGCRRRAALHLAVLLLVAGPAAAQTPHAAPRLTGGTIDGTTIGHGKPVSLTASDISSTTAPSVACNSPGQNGTKALSTATVCLNVRAPVSGFSPSNYAPISASIYSANNETTAHKQNPDAAVGEYIHAVSGPGSMDVWAQNPIVDIFPGSPSGGIVDEADLNNWGCDPGDLDHPSGTCKIAAIGTLYEGASPYASQEAIDISGVSTGNPQWHQGIAMVGGSIIDYASIYQDDGAQYGYLDKGAHGQSVMQLLGSSGGPAINVATRAPIGIDLANMPDGTNVLLMKAGQLATWASPAGHNVSITASPEAGTASPQAAAFVVRAGAKPMATLDQEGNLHTGGGVSAGGAIMPAVYGQHALPPACRTGQQAYGRAIRTGSQPIGAGGGSPVYCNDRATWVLVGTGTAPTY